MRLTCLLLILSACGVAHPLDGLSRSGQAQAMGYTYRVNWNAEAAQVTRMTPTWRPDYGQVARGAVIAAEQVSGCAVRPATVQGDVAMVNMTLDCSVRRGL